MLGRQSARSGKRSVGTREAKRSGSKSHDRDTKWCAQEAKRFAMRSLERQCARSGRQVSVLGMKSVSAQEANRSGGEAVARKVKRSLVTLTALRLVTNLVSHKSRWSRISSIANLVRQQTRWSLISSFMCHVIQILHYPKLEFLLYFVSKACAWIRCLKKRKRNYGRETCVFESVNLSFG